MGKGGAAVEREVRAGHAVAEKWMSRRLHDNVNMKSGNVSSCIVAQKKGGDGAGETCMASFQRLTKRSGFIQMNWLLSSGDIYVI